MRKKIFLIAFIVILADQIIKFLIKDKSFTIIDGFLKFEYTTNQGAAFGILQGWRIFLIIVSLLLVFLIFQYSKNVKKKDYISGIGLGLLLGGTIGNLSDRIFLGYVVDFIDFGFFPVFNIADIANVIGAGFLIYSFIKNDF